MTAADFTRQVRAELDQLRCAHVVAAVVVSTDVMVGVSLALDGKPYEFTRHGSNMEQRALNFEVVLSALRNFRRDHMPSTRTTRRQRLAALHLRIPVERHVRRERWSMLAILAGSVAICAVVLVAIGWFLS